MMSNAGSIGEYQRKIDQLDLVRTKGLLGVKAVGDQFVACSFIEWLCNHFNSLVGFQSQSLTQRSTLIRKNVSELNSLHDGMNENSPLLKSYFAAGRVVGLWNEFIDKNALIQKAFAKDLIALRVGYRELIPINLDHAAFPKDLFDCFISNVHSIPLIVVPKTPWKIEEFQTHLKLHQKSVGQLIDKTGALLFRGFPIHTAQEFRETLEAALGKVPSKYVGDGLRKKEDAEGVFQSTDAPVEFPIQLHNEVFFAQQDTCSWISFFCMTPPAPGSGQTTLGSSVKVAETLRKKEVWSFFEGKTVRHIMTHPTRGSFCSKVNSSHKCWQQVFGKETQEEVTKYLSENGIEHKFFKDGTLQIIHDMPAFKTHPRKFGPLLWGNQAYQFHHNARKHGGWLYHLAVNILYPKKHTKPYHVEFSDGTQIPEDMIYQIYDALEENSLYTDWKKGDLLVLDNHSVMHGRAPSKKKGPRKILTGVVN